MKEGITVAEVQDEIYKITTQIMTLVNQFERYTGCRVDSSISLDRVNTVSGETQVVNVDFDVKI